MKAVIEAVRDKLLELEDYVQEALLNCDESACKYKKDLAELNRLKATVEELERFLREHGEQV